MHAFVSGSDDDFGSGLKSGFLAGKQKHSDHKKTNSSKPNHGEGSTKKTKPGIVELSDAEAAAARSRTQQALEGHATGVRSDLDLVAP